MTAGSVATLPNAEKSTMAAQKIAASAGPPVRDFCLAPERAAAVLDAGARYGRMFDLPALEADETLLHELGAHGGFCDGGEAESDSTTEAGWPFFGQYVAHDLTADRSPLRAHADLAALRNVRSPRANLESLYGGGPVGSPYLYRRDDPARFLENGGDLPRNQEGVALAGDPRNDTHSFMNQLQVAFIRAHNRLVDRLREDGAPEPDLFDEARRSLAWHYQWLIVNEYLPGLVGPDLVRDVLTEGPRFYRPEAPYIPVEFADAAFRYGHSQIRQRYQLRTGGPGYAVFPDLMGFGPIGDRMVDWSLLFDVPGRPPAQRARAIDGSLPQALIRLPEAITGTVEDDTFHSLAARDLVRGLGTSLPSGEAVARAMGVEPLTSDELDLREHGWRSETPLWLYVLREAWVRQGGDRLGDVGGRIVAEVLVWIIRSDPESYLRLDPAWAPTLPRRAPTFRLTDLLVPDA
jgi:hypothetical protein